MSIQHVAYGIPLYLDDWFTRRRALNDLPYTYMSPCKMKRPLLGQFLRIF